MTSEAVADFRAAEVLMREAFTDVDDSTIKAYYEGLRQTTFQSIMGVVIETGTNLLNLQIKLHLLNEEEARWLSLRKSQPKKPTQ